MAGLYGIIYPWKKLHKSETSTAEMVTISRVEYEALKAQNAELSGQVDWLLEQMRLAKKKLFGASSEKIQEEVMGPDELAV